MEKVKKLGIKTALKIIELKNKRDLINKALDKLGKKLYEKYGESRFDYNLPEQDKDGNQSFYVKIADKPSYISVKIPEYSLETRRMKKKI